MLPKNEGGMLELSPVLEPTYWPLRSLCHFCLSLCHLGSAAISLLRYNSAGSSMHPSVNRAELLQLSL